jgi:hypothetical protein
VAERFSRRLGTELPRLARSMDPDAARRAADLYVRLAEDKDRRGAQAIADALLDAIEEARTE